MTDNNQTPGPAEVPAPVPTPDPAPTPVAPRPKRSNYGWMGYFAFLIIASVGVAGFMIWFNYRMQLTPKQLDEAHNLWKDNGPKSYNMIYSKKIGTMDHADEFKVKVRNGVVIEVKLRDEPLKRPKEAEPDYDPRVYHSMDNIFRDMQRFMEKDQKKDANKVYVVANFDPKTGAVQRYIRYDMRSKERVELNILPLEVVEE